jgi:hypothetical protein
VADESGPFDEALTPRLAALELGWRAWRAGWSARVVTSARGSVAHARAEPGGAEPRLAAVLGRHLMMLRHDRPAALLADAPWLAAAEVRELLSLLAAGPGRPLQLLRAGTVARRRVRERRRADASRRGTWGPWRRDVPPRGVWREARSGPSVSEEAPR